MSIMDVEIGMPWHCYQGVILREEWWSAGGIRNAAGSVTVSTMCQDGSKKEDSCSCSGAVLHGFLLPFVEVALRDNSAASRTSEWGC